uniref:Cyclic nucleotide-binding protein n=1 Tax=Candidatus Kentrum sp. TUN TaxID=2126343 RepID=A0A450ZS27_9GAMM|nr:MAG: cyclic nucleotide-binding protein [Candidatus Kentron sp. TUN]VFK62854.1 MAG: cyclic nucleotide-binding protein [Candidatus Kentron sp. TUN]
MPFPPHDELAGIGFFSEFTQEVLEEIVPLCKPLFLRSGRIVFRHGSPYRNVIHIIRSGVARQVWPNGKSSERYAGDVLGLTGYLDNRPYTSTVITMEDCEFLLLSARELRRLEATHRSVSDAMDRIIAERIHCCVAETINAAAPLLILSVSHAMKTPLISCKPDTSLREAFVLMRKRGIGSLAVIDDADDLSGLLTYSGLYEAILERGISPEGKVSSVKYQPPCEIAEGVSLRQAEHLQEHRGVKYLIVSREGKPVGILSQTDILRAITAVSPPLLAEIQRAEDFVTLNRLYGRLPQFTADIRNWNRSITATVRVLSEAHQAILKRCITLTLMEFVKHGQGSPPCPFALLILGSGGRDEMLLTPDQDNAIILADEIGKDATARKWFANFTDSLNRRMADVGYALCPGEIMARNPAWRKGLSDWKRQFNHIIHYPTPKAARWSNIVLDFKFLYGDETLLSGLRQEIMEKLRENSRLLKTMVEDDARGKPPLGFFDRLITTTADGKKRRIDLKRDALRIVADAARVYAWREGIHANNTVDRFQGLSYQGVLSREFVKTILAAYDALLDLCLEQRLQRVLDGKPESMLLDYDLLSLHEQELLRISLRAVKRLQERLQEDFEVGLW